LDGGQCKPPLHVTAHTFSGLAQINFCHVACMLARMLACVAALPHMRFSGALSLLLRRFVPVLHFLAVQNLHPAWVVYKAALTLYDVQCTLQ